MKVSDGNFQLYIRSKEAKAMEDLMVFVKNLPDNERQAWLQEHADFLDRAFENMLDATDHTFSRINFDTSLFSQTKDLLTTIQRTQLQLSGLLGEKKLSS